MKNKPLMTLRCPNCLYARKYYVRPGQIVKCPKCGVVVRGG